MKGGITGRGFGTLSPRRHAAIERLAMAGRRTKRHPPERGQASVKAKILARMVALGRASRA